MPAILGLRGTGQFGTDFRPANYRELFTLLEPNGDAPLNAMLSMTQAEATDDPKFNNFRDEMPDRTITVGGAYAADAATTTIDVTAASQSQYAVKGAVIVNSRTGEVMHVTDDYAGDNKVKVTRNVGGTSLTLNAGDKWFVSGFAASEGGSTPTAVSFDPVFAYNYLQIFKTPFNVTNTLANTYRRIGDAEDEYATKALKLHMSDIERAMFFGRRAEVNGTSSAPTRFYGGLINSITNVIDVSTAGASPDGVAGTIIEKSFDRLLIEDVFAYGSKQRVVFGGPVVAGHLHQFAKSRWTLESIDGGYGVSFTRYKTFAGDLMFHLHPQFRQVPGADSMLVFVDFPYLRYRYLQNRDTQLLKDRQAPGDDKKTHEYLTECGLELLQDKVHHVIKVSTAFTQELEVGVKWKVQRGCRSSQACTFGCLWLP